MTEQFWNSFWNSFGTSLPKLFCPPSRRMLRGNNTDLERREQKVSKNGTWNVEQRGPSVEHGSDRSAGIERKRVFGRHFSIVVPSARAPLNAIADSALSFGAELTSPFNCALGSDLT